LRGAINISHKLNAKLVTIAIYCKLMDYVKSIRKLQKSAVVLELLIIRVLSANLDFILSTADVNNQLFLDVLKKMLEEFA